MKKVTYELKIQPVVAVIYLGFWLLYSIASYIWGNGWTPSLPEFAFGVVMLILIGGYVERKVEGGKK